jgi:hypothetical protein
MCGHYEMCIVYIYYVDVGTTFPKRGVCVTGSAELLI